MTREMRDSGVEWIGKIPKNWRVSKIKYELECKDELREPISAEKRERKNPQYDYYGASGIIDKIDYYNIDDEVLLIGEDGANLLMRNLPLVYKAKGKFWVNNHAHILKPFSHNNYDYLGYLLEVGDYTNYITGSAQPKLSQSNLMSFYILSMPIDEQKKIADYLDKKCAEIDSLSSDIQSQINILEDYKKSVITEAVTKGLNPNVEMKDSGIGWIGEIPENWEIDKIKYIFAIGKGLPITKENLIDEGLAVVSYGQIHSKTNTGVEMESSLLRFVDLKYQERYPQCQVYQYDFVFADTSEDIEGCGNCVYKREDSILFAGYHSIILHSTIPQDNRYLAYLFKTDCWRKQIRETVSGVKVFSITQKELINLSVIIPSFEEQQNIANYLDKKCAEIATIIAEKKKQLEILEQYKKSLIFECVTGKREILADD